MNMHVPQTYETIAEVKENMMVSNCIVSAQSNKPVMGIVQDSLLSCRLLTKRDTFIEKDEFMNILMNIDMTDKIMPKPCILKPKPLWSGKQLINMILPNINLFRYAAWHNESDIQGFSESDTELYINNGDYLSGTMCKKTLGTSSGSLIHIIWTNHGSKIANRFISDIQFLANNWIVNRGFSVGIQDAINREHIQKEVNTIIDDADTKVKEIIEIGQKENQTPKSYEKKINMILNKARDTAGLKVQDDLTTNNNIYSMVTGGSKGSIINISQIMACVGQQNIGGQRIGYGYIDRTLPHFEKNDNTADSRGFVKHSYLKGLSPSEFFFHAMGGREGIIDTAVKTSETGYIQRRLIKAMEDIKVHYDGTVRNSINDIIQYRYGDDNMDGCHLMTQDWKGERYHLPFSIKTLQRLYHPINDEEESKESNLDNIVEHNELYIYILQSLFDNKQPSDDIIQLIEDQYRKAKVCAGEMVGTIAAQSIGEPVTQLTLNTFHFSGVSEKNVTLGVPRLKELINLTKNIKSPTMYIRLDNEYDELMMHKISKRFEYSIIDDYIVSKSVQYNMELYDFEKEYYKLLDEIDTTNFTWCITLKLDTKKMLSDHVNCHMITSMINSKVINVTCCSNFKYDKPYSYIIIRTLTEQYNIENIEILKNKILYDIEIKGIKDVSKLFIKNKNTLESDGSNLKELLSSKDNIDVYNCFSNNIIEVYELLGIEAARTVLLNEIRNVIQFDGSYVNVRHLTLLVDTMTYRGGLMSITRHGINRNDTGPLMKCSFEETVNVLINAAVNSQVDHLRGVTETIMLGKTSKVGTGFMDIFLDIDKLCDNYSEFRPSSPKRSSDSYFSSFFPLKELEY